MIHVVGACAQRGQDGGVGQGGAVVTEAAAAHDSSDGGVHQIVGLTAGHIEGQRHGNGDHDGVHAPAGAGEESHEGTDSEGQSQQGHGGHPALGDADDVAGGAQRLGDGVDAVGQGQDQDGADHGLDALGGHLDHLTDVEGLLDQQHDGLIGNGQHEGLQRLGGAHNDVGADGGADDNFFLLPFDDVNVYCEKKFGVYLELPLYTEGRARQIIDYIRSTLRQTESVELWNVWLLGYWEYDDRPYIRKKTVNINDLTVTDIKEINNAENWNNKDPNRPSFYCLEIIK